jgi:uncharacterized protein YukE
MNIREFASKYSVTTEEYGEVIPISKLEEMLAEFENKPFEDKLQELDSAMKQLNNMINNLGKEIND